MDGWTTRGNEAQQSMSVGQQFGPPENTRTP
jgi:hypothetical protein